VGRAAKLQAMIGLTFAQLRHYRTRTALAAICVALAVLLMVLLSGLDYGLTSTGGKAMTWINTELCVTIGSVALAPTSVGGVENPIQNSHEVDNKIETTEGVAAAHPVAFQSVYVSTDGEEFDTIVGVGGLGDGKQLGVAKRTIDHRQSGIDHR